MYNYIGWLLPRPPETPTAQRRPFEMERGTSSLCNINSCVFASPPGALREMNLRSSMHNNNNNNKLILMLLGAEQVNQITIIIIIN